MHLRSCPDPVTTLRPTANLAIETTSQLLLAKALQGQQPADMMQQHHLQLPTEPSNIGPFDPTSCQSLYIGNLPVWSRDPAARPVQLDGFCFRSQSHQGQGYRHERRIWFCQVPRPCVSTAAVCALVLACTIIPAHCFPSAQHTWVQAAMTLHGVSIAVRLRSMTFTVAM